MATVQQLLEKFHEVASSPQKQMEYYIKEGKKVVACVPIYTPEEIIHSMGMIPMGTWGADVEVKEAKRYFPAFICSIMQSVLELGINGKYKGVSAIVIPYLCDSLMGLGENWKMAVPDIPFIPMQYPQNRKPEYGIEFTKQAYLRVIRDLENITGAKFSEDNLKKSCDIYNAHNKAMREISSILADHPEISAVNRKDIFKSAYFMEKEEHTRLVNELIALLKAQPKQDNNKIKIVTSGILADSENLLKIIDDNNMQIVADDVAHESRQYRVDVPVDGAPLDNLAKKFSAMDHCSVLYDVDKKRADYIVNLAKQYNAKGVIVILTKFCDPEEYDYPILKGAFDKANLPSTLIEVDRQMVNYEQAKTNIQTFREVLEY